MTFSNAYPKHTTNTKTIVFTQLYPPFVFLFSTQKPARHLFRYRHGWRGWRSNRPLRQPLSFPAFSNTVMSLQQGRWIKNLLMILMGIQPTRWKVNPPKHSAIIHGRRSTRPLKMLGRWETRSALGLDQYPWFRSQNSQALVNELSWIFSVFDACPVPYSTASSHILDFETSTSVARYPRHW